MLGISGPVWGAIASGFATLTGLSFYNLTSRPTVQTVQGISNTVLIAVSGAVVLVSYMQYKKRRG